MATDGQPRNGLRLTHAIPCRAAGSAGRAVVFLAPTSCQLLWRRAAVAALRPGRGVVAKPGPHPDCLRPTQTGACTQERSTGHSEDDAVVWPKPTGWIDRDGSTDAGLQTLPRSPPSGAGDPGRSIAKLDGGLASKLPLMWRSFGGFSSAEPANEGRSSRPA